MVLAVCHAVNIISDSFLQFRRVELGSGKCKTCILSGVRMMVSCDVKWDKRPDCEPQRSFKEIRYIHHKQKNKVKFSDADTRLTAKSYYPSAKMCLSEILLTAWDAIAHGIMGRRFPDGGLLWYRKWVPQQLGDVIFVTNSPPIGHMRSQLTNHQVGIVLDVQAWSEKLY